MLVWYDIVADDDSISITSFYVGGGRGDEC